MRISEAQHFAGAYICCCLHVILFLKDSLASDISAEMQLVAEKEIAILNSFGLWVGLSYQQQT